VQLREGFFFLKRSCHMTRKASINTRLHKHNAAFAQAQRSVCTCTTQRLHMHNAAFAHAQRSSLILHRSSQASSSINWVNRVNIRQRLLTWLFRLRIKLLRCVMCVDARFSECRVMLMSASRKKTYLFVFFSFFLYFQM